MAGATTPGTIHVPTNYCAAFGWEILVNSRFLPRNWGGGGALCGQFPFEVRCAGPPRGRGRGPLGVVLGFADLEDGLQLRGYLLESLVAM